MSGRPSRSGGIRGRGSWARVHPGPDVSAFHAAHGDARLDCDRIRPAAPATEPPTPPGRRRPVRTTEGRLDADAPAARRPEFFAGHEEIIRSPEHFLTVLRGLGGRGGLLRIGTGVDLELPTVVIEPPAANLVQILAEPEAPCDHDCGSGRRRCRANPRPTGSGSSASAPARSGSREWTSSSRTRQILLAERLAAVAVSPGTELTMTDCTITVSVRRSTATAVVVFLMAVAPVGEPNGPRWSPGRSSSCATLKCSGGDAFTVAGGAHLELKLEDARAAATEGSLLHALGSVRAAAWGVSSRARPERPHRSGRGTGQGRARLLADDAGTAPDGHQRHPRRRLDREHRHRRRPPVPRGLEGQDELEALWRLIRWQARKVAYHRIKTYRAR